MKGIILAGGTGSRLFPSTKVTNKHLLPVWDKPMVLYPLETLKNSGIREILIVTSSANAGDFMKLLGSGIEYGVHLTYKIQDGSGGVAQALSLAEGFAANEDIAVILSDNIFENDFSREVMHFKSGAQIFVKEVEDPERFGVVEIDQDGIVRSLEEKPTIPKSNLAQTGFYLYDSEVFSLIREIEPSRRGELEITDLNAQYLKKGKMRATKVFGMWIDAGTHESLLEASFLAQEAFSSEKMRERKSLRQTQNQKNFVPSVLIGIVTYNSEKYIKPCLESLLNQTYENCKIKIFDNASTDETLSIIRSEFPEIEIIESNANIGFSRAHNRLITSSVKDFYLCTNVDTCFERNFLQELVHSIEEKPIYGSSGGKLKRWDFEKYQAGESNKGQTNFLDSVGISISASHNFIDQGQGEIDFGQYDKPSSVFGITGAAVLYRKKALEDIAFKNENGEIEYFDEQMFLYKEDVDIAYRLQWGGWKSIYTPKATGYHHRTIAMKKKTFWSRFRNRLEKPTSVNRMSLLNHKILLEKNFSTGFSGRIRSATFWNNCKTFFFILIFETELLGVWWKVFKMKKRIKQWKKQMPRRIGKEEIEVYMKKNKTPLAE